MSTHQHRTNAARRDPASAMPVASVSARRAPSGHVARWRDDSVLDRNIPLAVPVQGRPERGPTAFAYYRQKFARREYGRFWLHHVALAPPH